MPYIVVGEPDRSKTDYTDKEYDYDYPHGLNLKPGSDLHDKIRNKIWQRARESRNEMSKRFPSWNAIDQTLTVYITLDDKEKMIKDKDIRKPVSIVFPYSYSVLEALLTYMSMAFFQDPMFRYEGVEDDDTIGGMLMELVVKMHCLKNKVALNVHTSIRDSLAYGVGIAIPGWTKRYGKVPIKSTVITQGPLGEESDESVEFVNQLIFEGNDLTNVDPYMWLPDISVSSDNIQKGEYVGWLDRDNIMNMLSEENEPNSELFNVKYLRAKKNKRSALSTDQSERNRKTGGNAGTLVGATDSLNPVDNIKMYVNLIPKEWELGDSEYPEKWFFCLSADDVITQCSRADHNHGQYPMAVASPEFDGYSITPIARMEILQGLQGTLDFLFNMRIANVKKSLNDMFVVDPYLININDLKDPEPGKLIRMRRPAWGHGVKGAVEQLKVQDITQSNLSDSMYITQAMDRISGADASMQGALRTGGPERLTKGEFQGTRGSAVSRLQRLAMIIGMQFMQDIGTQFAVHTQQYMKKETYVSIVGKYEQQLFKRFNRKKVKVSPLDLAISTDLIVRDGSIPGGNFSEAWIQMFNIIGNSEQLTQEFDMFRIFTYIASELGAKNVEDFRRVVDQTQVTTIPDEEAARQAQAGNLVPLED